MKTFKIIWQNCFMQEGTAKVKAKTRAAAETEFAKQYGPDYLIIASS